MDSGHVNSGPKVAREHVAKNMLEILATHAASTFHFLFTGDESWLLYADHVRTMWTLCPENADQVQGASHVTKKTMATMFFNGTRLHMIDILPQNQKMDAGYFSEYIIPSLVSICYPTGRSCRQRKCLVHFDNAPIHNSKAVTDKLDEQNLKRIPHPPYSPDLSPCDFFLFGYLNDKWIDKQDTTPQELFAEVTTIISEISSDLISRVFATWQKRLQKCCDMRGN
jgi:histone-lysine N-methyltransferase SETMAR